MDPTTRQGISVAAGAGGGEGLYADEVFSTFLYEGNNTTGRDIVNGIDLSGEGGLVWVKRRTPAEDHVLLDTERGPNNFLMSNRTNAATTTGGPITAFNADGFEVDNNGYVNGNSNGYVSWTFRKAPGFFDVVTYTGDGISGKTISHNLGSVPGFIIIKNLDAVNAWNCWHRSVTSPNSDWWQNYLTLNTNNAAGSWTTGLTAEPTSTSFTVGTGGGVNNSGVNYVAYIFAHDDQSFGTNSDEAIVKCGSYTGNGSTTGPVVDLGFEPQWLLVKLSSTSGGYWVMLDNMRGVTADGATSILYANDSSAEVTSTFASFSSTGFQPRTSSNYMNSSGQTYIYVAIRRPHKPPTAATEVFNADYEYGTNTSISGYLGYVADMNIINVRAGNANNSFLRARLTGDGYLATSNTAGQVSQTIGFWDNMLGFYESSGTLDTGKIQYIFRRAPGFFDVVTWIGNSQATGADNKKIQPHGLGVAPELIIMKNRTNTWDWWSWHKGLTSSATKQEYAIRLNLSNAEIELYGPGNGPLLPDADNFYLASGSQLNQAGYPYIAYLFATLNGISKVGTYSGTGNNIDVDCGFTAGARFILIKRTDSTGDWYVWDTQRGIVSGNDPYLLLNSTAAEVTNTDYIDPLNAGFTITSSAPAALNTSGGTYIFLAIA